MKFKTKFFQIRVVKSFKKKTKFRFRNSFLIVQTFVDRTNDTNKFAWKAQQLYYEVNKETVAVGMCRKIFQNLRGDVL